MDGQGCEREVFAEILAKSLPKRTRLVRKTPPPAVAQGSLATESVYKIMGESAGAKLHASHAAFATNDAVLCGKCGAFAASSAKSRLLASTCRESVCANWAVKQLKRLLRGKLPYREAAASKPVRARELA